MSRVGAVVFVVLLVAAGCGGDDGTAGDAASPFETSTSTTTASPTTSAPSGELPGERVEIFPYEGAELAVVGVAADDALNVRTGPGVDFDLAFTLDPLHRGVTATGHNRRLEGGGMWAEVRDVGRTGWANASFLLQPGRVTDETARLYPRPDDRPTAETLTDLARTVAAEVASDEPPSDVTIADGPHVGDLGEVTVDVTGLGDDAVGGYRLHLFAEPDPGGESFTLRTVESTALCSRGVTGDGLCT